MFSWSVWSSHRAHGLIILRWLWCPFHDQRHGPVLHDAQILPSGGGVLSWDAELRILKIGFVSFLWDMKKLFPHMFEPESNSEYDTGLHDEL